MADNSNLTRILARYGLGGTVRFLVGGFSGAAFVALYVVGDGYVLKAPTLAAWSDIAFLAALTIGPAIWIWILVGDSIDTAKEAEVRAEGRREGRAAALADANKALHAARAQNVKIGVLAEDPNGHGVTLLDLSPPSRRSQDEAT